MVFPWAKRNGRARQALLAGRLRQRLFVRRTYFPTIEREDCSTESGEGRFLNDTLTNVMGWSKLPANLVSVVAGFS